jgi:hypothetical protein
MKFLIGILFSLLFTFLNVNAQNGNYELGARSLALSGSTTTISDAYSGFNNIGALAGNRGISVCFSSSILFEIPELLKIGFGLNGELFKGIGSVNIYRFGNGDLSEQKISLGYSHQIRFISLGIQLSYVQFLISGYGSAGSISLEFGGLIKFSKKFIIGSYLLHPFGSSRRSENLSFLNTISKAGISYRPSEYLMANIDFKWKFKEEIIVIVGFEYLIRGKVALRAGFNIDTLQSTMGIGLSPGKFRLDYAVMIHPVLGISNELSVNINFYDP